MAGAVVATAVVAGVAGAAVAANAGRIAGWIKLPPGPPGAGLDVGVGVGGVVAGGGQTPTGRGGVVLSLWPS